MKKIRIRSTWPFADFQKFSNEKPLIQEMN